ncbi:MAG: phosphoribosylformylglycinamidine synthase subunit PurS [Candidatus Nitrosocosmicus sp.]|nr:phosphoribosylformylglycinamidine synthase subunit PurS [Candidatus Nitrosocosmicus sp.]MDN5866062.1 phosphoribosylformylglycinamidine synthase subunit PurS [Candidatus Nitrosocosmicus sp.]
MTSFFKKYMTDARKKKTFMVSVSIENKPFLNDPEGETVLNDLILKENYSDIVSVRSAKSLLIKILSENETEALLKVKKMCEDLRIYNPIVSNCELSIRKTQTK